MSDIRIHIRLAESHADVLRCQHLIAGVYKRAYHVDFSEADCDLEARIEAWPHRYVLGLIGNDLVCAAGLYLRDTYVERFGNVEPGEFQEIIEAAGAAPRHDALSMREYTKLVIREDWRGRGLARFFMAATHSRHFLQVETHADTPAVMVMCGKRSIFRHVWAAAGIRTRHIKPFPIYRTHELYASAVDPMESCMVIPELDVPPEWYELELPGTFTVRPIRSVVYST